jgi:tetratricopeptide (TPR) repeat protein
MRPASFSNLAHFRLSGLGGHLIAALFFLLSLNCQTAEAQFMARDEKKAAALCTLAEAAIAKGDLDKAKSCYVEANLYNSSDARVMLGFAKIAELKGNLDEAIRRARLAANYDATNPSVHAVLGSYLESNQDFRAAELQYERAVELTKSKEDQVPFCSKAVKSLVELEDFERADKLSKSWLKMHSSFAQSHYDRGLVLMHSTNPQFRVEALKQFDKALEMDPKMNMVHYQLGVLQGELGEKDVALKELNAFIASHPGPEELKLANEQIEKLKSQ